MSEIKLFLRDFITPAKIKRYAGYVFVFAVFIQIFFQDQAVFRLSGSAGSMIGYGIAFTSAVYVTHTYPVFENIGFYLALPVKKRRILCSPVDMHTPSEDIVCSPCRCKIQHPCSGKSASSYFKFRNCSAFEYRSAAG